MYFSFRQQAQRQKRVFSRSESKNPIHLTPHRNEGCLGFGPELRGHEKLTIFKIFKKSPAFFFVIFKLT